MSEHHPSCQPSDRDLVWMCAQCGCHESAENMEMPVHVRLALRILLNHITSDPLPWKNCKSTVQQWLYNLPE